jgi:hypothetical protein
MQLHRFVLHLSLNTPALNDSGCSVYTFIDHEFIESHQIEKYQCHNPVQYG